MTIDDTSKRDPLLHLAGVMIEGTSGYIEGMEAAGQRQVVASTLLPIETLYCTDEDFVALGFTFGEAKDDLFREATLPDGWSRAGTDHSMWSNVVDERGIERVSIFYKAAFYDRSAHMGIANVGGGLASKFIYGDGEEDTATPWDVLTEAERDDYRSALRSYVEQAEAYPSIYGDRLPKVERRLAVLS